MCVKQTHKYLQMWLIHLMHHNTKGPIESEQKSKNMTLLVRMGSALLRPDPTVGGEQRELCGHGQDQEGEAGEGAGCYGGDNRHTVSPSVLHQAR